MQQERTYSVWICLSSLVYGKNEVASGDILFRIPKAAVFFKF